MIERTDMNDVKSTVVTNLLRIAPHLQIVHHIPGRIRLRISPSGLQTAMEIDLRQIRDNVPGILSLRINALVGSIVIEYDRNRLNPDLWNLLSRLRKAPELRAEAESRLTSLWD